jgi:hypothetical protein
MFGKQPPSALLWPNASLQASSIPRPSPLSPPSHSANSLSSHSASGSGAPPTSFPGPTRFAARVTYNISLLYGDLPSKDKQKDKDKFVPSLSPTLTIKGTNSDSSLVAPSSLYSSTGSMTGLSNGFEEQQRGWNREGLLAASPEGAVLDTSPADNLSAPRHQESPYRSRSKSSLLEERHSAQFVHYRNSLKSLAMIIDSVGSLPIFGIVCQTHYFSTGGQSLP